MTWAARSGGREVEIRSVHHESSAWVGPVWRVEIDGDLWDDHVELDDAKAQAEQVVGAALEWKTP